MSKQTESSFLIASSVSGLYQHLLSGAANYHELASRVLRQMEVANAFRQTEKVRELARILVHTPIREYRLSAQYHLALCKCREREYHADVLERIAEHSHTYKAKALISRASLDVYQSNAESALYFYSEALKVNPTVSDFIKASTGIATVKSMEGYHAAALRELEKLIPLLKYAEPLTYFQMVNSYAVESAEANNLAAAQTAALVAVSSQLGPSYPEWRDTLSDVKSKLRRHSTISFSRPQIEREYEAKLEVTESAINKARAQTVVDFMRVNLHRKIVLAELAEIVHLSSSHLSHLFKVQTGCSPGNYLIRLRMKKARDLLITRFESIKEIMVMVGYSNKSNFVRHFKKYYTVSPSEYRKRDFPAPTVLSRRYWA